MKKFFFSLFSTLCFFASVASAQENCDKGTALQQEVPCFVLPDTLPLHFEKAIVLPADTPTSKYLRNTTRYENFFKRLVPTHTELQYAGSIGFLSMGVGWNYFHSRWKSELLLGYVPKFHSDDEKYVLTYKQIYDPFRLHLNKRLIYHPLQTGLFCSYIFGGEFWDSEPKRYPKHYYGFSSGFRLNVLLGGQITYLIPWRQRRMHKNASLYYEFSTCDLYLASAFPNKNIKWTDILSLGLGIRMDIF